MVKSILETKPRHYVEVLKDYDRLLHLEAEKRRAVIESATPLNRSLGDRIIENLKARYGEDITTEFHTNPELIGGLKIKIGDDVWDGSIKHRLNELQESF